MVKVFLKKGKEEPVRRKHPWVFSGAIARIEGQAEDGEIATVFDFKGNFLGTGHFHHRRHGLDFGDVFSLADALSAVASTMGSTGSTQGLMRVRSPAIYAKIRSMHAVYPRAWAHSTHKSLPPRHVPVRDVKQEISRAKGR